MSYTPPPDSEPAVNVLSNLARGRFSRQSRPLAAGTESSAECSALSTVYPTSPHSSDFSYKASPDAQASDDEALALSPELALRVDILGRLPVEISIYCLLFADPIDVLSARLVCRHISAIASDNLVWRDFFHRNPAWRVRPDLLKSVEDAQAAAAIAPLSLDAEAETEEDPHLATPTKPSRHQPQQGARKKLKQGPLSSSYTPRKSNKKLTTADLLGLDTEFGSLSIGEHSTPRSSQQQKTTQSQRQTLPAHAAAFATPVRQPAPSPVSETGRSSVFPTIKSVPSPYFIRPLVAPLNGLNWLDLYARRNELDRRWRMGKSHTSVLRGHKDNIYCVASDSDWIITGSRDPSIKLWDLHTGICKHTITGMPTSVLCLDHDGRHLVFGCSDASIYVYSMVSWKLVRRMLGHTGGVLDVSIGQKYIASSSKDCTIRIWDRDTGETLRILREHNGAVNALGLKGDRLISAGGDSCLKLWDVSTGKVIRDFVGHERGLACFAWDGNRCVSGGNDRTIRIWDVDTGHCLNVLRGHNELVRCLAFDSKAQRIVSGSYDRTVRLWDAESGEPLVEYRGGHSSYVFGVSIDSSRIITSSHDKRIIVLDFGHGIDVSPFV